MGGAAGREGFGYEGETLKLAMKQFLESSRRSSSVLEIIPDEAARDTTSVYCLFLLACCWCIANQIKSIHISRVSCPFFFFLLSLIGYSSRACHVSCQAELRYRLRGGY